MLIISAFIIDIFQLLLSIFVVAIELPTLMIGYWPATSLEVDL